MAFCLSANADTQDWAQWRGPTRDGTVPAAHVPAAWPTSFRRAWTVQVGEGYSSPVMTGSLVFVHSRRDPAEVVTAIDFARGEVKWQQSYAAPYLKNQYALGKAKGPHSTPLVAGDRLFTVGASAIVAAWDTATGRQLWINDYSQTIDSSKMFCGTAASPLATDRAVVIQVGSDVHGGQVLALEPSTGAVKWTWRGPGPGYASPISVDVAGSRQIVAVTERSIVGLDSNSGLELWSTPFPDEWHENIVTPIWTGATLVVSGTRIGTHAYTLKKIDGQWQASEVWKNPEVAMYMSSPVIGDGLIYGHSAKKRGQFIALEAESGAMSWASDGRDGDHASVLLTPHHVVYLSDTGTLTVVRRQPAAFEIEKHYDLAEADTWATPVIAGTDLLVRNASSLIRFSGSVARAESGKTP